MSIAKIAASSTLVPLGLNPDKTVEVPPVSRPEQAGVYINGPTPGDPGPAVVLGHVNGAGRPGVFARLAELRPGDEVDVTRLDGRTATFRVYRTDTVNKDDFPTSAVYSDTPGAELRLITCGGDLDRAANSYLSNVLVYAALTTLR
ncbi:class F sortase [Actinomycetospora flava]|uniref:Class F sortase n=1 Tax=Actinomycetospora flava TaxID=3129232 RepID=A0ABU8M5E5_9PSEU